MNNLDKTINYLNGLLEEVKRQKILGKEKMSDTDIKTINNSLKQINEQ